MAAKKPSPDRGQDLSLIRASGSTARVLNLALVFERHGEGEEFRSKPLFRNQKLNRALILKHAIRPHERSLFARPEPHTTKIVFPFSPTELELGGTSVMVGEARFSELFRRALGAHASEADFEADLELVQQLHEIPSFDPFLLREHLKRAGHEAARCFFEISDADIARMHAFVQREIEPLVGQAFGAAGRRAEKLAERLAEKLMTDENAQLLAPLRETLRLTAGEFAEGVFAWKGFLYYKWMLSEFDARHADFSAKFTGCAIVSDDTRARREVERLRQTVLTRMHLVLGRGGEAILAYDHAFSALARGDAVPFRSFLIAAPAQFIPLGEALGAVKHIHTFWGFRFPASAALRIEAEEAGEILQEFDRMLNGIQLVRGGLSQEVALD